MKPTEKKPEKSDSRKEMDDFDIYIDEFGQVQSTISQERLNLFLNEEVEDKKFSSEVKEQLKELYSEATEEE